MVKRGGSLAHLLMLALCAGLSVATWLAARENIETSPVTSPSTPQAASVPPLQMRAHAKLEELAETTQRPLFAPTRRPAPAPTAPGPSETAQQQPADQTGSSAEPARMPTMTLLGTLKVGRERSRALLRADNANSADWVDLGGEIAGWRLSEVAKDHIVLEAAGQKSTLTLYPVRAAAN